MLGHRALPQLQGLAQMGKLRPCWQEVAEPTWLGPQQGGRSGWFLEDYGHCHCFILGGDVGQSRAHRPATPLSSLPVSRGWGVGSRLPMPVCTLLMPWVPFGGCDRDSVPVAGSGTVASASPFLIHCAVASSCPFGWLPCPQPSSLCFHSRLPRSKRRAMEAQVRSEVLAVLSNLADLANAVHWLPRGILWAGRFPPWLVGLLGTVSSLLSVYQAVQARGREAATTP